MSAHGINRPSSAELKHWNDILREEGLDMDAGRDPGHRKLINVGNSSDLERLDAEIRSRRHETGGGKRTRPKTTEI